MFGRITLKNILTEDVCKFVHALIHFVGKLRDAVACYERAIQIEPDNIKHYKGMLDGLIGLGQLNNALMDVGGVINKR